MPEQPGRADFAETAETRHAEPDEIARATLEQIQQRLDDPHVSAEDLAAVLSGAQRWLAANADHAESPAAEALEQAAEGLQDALIAQQLRSRRRLIADDEQADSLQRRVLDSLARGPRTPTQIAKAVRSPTPSISRTVNKLLADGLITRAPGIARDARLRQYALTRLGEAQLNTFRAFGAKAERPEQPAGAAAQAALLEAITVTIDFRRRTHRLHDAEQRFRAVLTKAEEIGADQVGLRARGELLTTLRQAGDNAERETHLNVLRRIAEGWENVPADLVSPAMAEFEYERGRCGDLTEQTEHLVTAMSLYNQLAAERDDPWLFARGAWAEACLANVWLERSDLDRALSYGQRSMESFKSINDIYGMSRASFVLGFTFRLRGQFAPAREHLGCAHELAIRGEFRRFRADSLMQMGEVRRCVGATDEARGMLSEARDLATELRTPIIQAFAESALGATVWQEQRDADAALVHLEAARTIFSNSHHTNGLALTLRRDGVVRGRAASGRAEARAILGEALSQYVDALSPAGVVACLVDLGWLAIRTRRSPRRYLRQLLLLLRPGSWTCRLVELDPWVPELLDEFAHSVGDGRLGELSQLVLAAAKNVRAEHDEEPSTLKSPATPAKQRAAAAVPLPDPMAGEPRRSRSKSVQLEPAQG